MTNTRSFIHELEELRQERDGLLEATAIGVPRLDAARKEIGR